MFLLIFLDGQQHFLQHSSESGQYEDWPAFWFIRCICGWLITDTHILRSLARFLISQGLVSLVRLGSWVEAQEDVV